MDRIRIAAALLFFFLLGGGSDAAFLIDPAGGAVLWDDSTSSDDLAVQRDLGFSFNLFGRSISSIYVTTNGNLNSIGTTSYNNTSFPLNFNAAMIAPLWDDLYVAEGSGQSITEQANGSYYAVTWDVSTYPAPGPRFAFQAALFGSAQVIDGVQYQAGDIVFSYDRVTPSFRDGNATIGLNEGRNLGYAPMPGTTNGIVTDGTIADLFGGHDAILFRADGQGGYSATLMTLESQAVPEPAGVAMLGTGAIALGVFARRRRAA